MQCATDITGPWLPSGRLATHRSDSGKSASTSGQESEEPPYKRLFIDVQDLPNEDLLVHFPEAIAFIAEGRKQGAVLVHCFAGVSRSVTVSVSFALIKPSVRCLPMVVLCTIMAEGLRMICLFC